MVNRQAYFTVQPFQSGWLRPCALIGGISLYFTSKSKIPLLLFALTYFLVGCATDPNANNWIGLSADEDTVYVASGTEVLAVDVASQDLLWQFPEETSPVPLFAAPAISDKKIVVGNYGAPGGFFSPQVVVTVSGLEYQDDTLDVLWENDVVAQGSVVAPPLIEGETVYLGTADNQVLALDLIDGSLIWQYETGHSIWGRMEYLDGTLYVNSLDKTLYAFNADTGDVRWQKTFDGALAGHPVLVDETLFIASFDRKLHALSAQDGAEQWAFDAQNWIWDSPAYANGSVYFADIDGNVYAVNASTGEQVWTQQIETAVQTAPIIANDVIYIASEGDPANTEEGVLVALSTDNGAELWRKTTPAPLYTTPVLVQDTLIVALQSEAALLMGFDPETGGQRWLFIPPEA